MRDAALELIDRGAGNTRCSIRFDLNVERIADTIAPEIDAGVEPIVGREMLFVANLGDLHVRDSFEQGANCVQGCWLQFLFSSSNFTMR